MARDWSSVDLIAVDALDTVGARLVAHLMLVDEERRPIEGEPDAGCLLARCFYDLAEAAAAVAELRGDVERDPEDAEANTLVIASVEFGWVAVSGLTAAGRISPRMREGSQPRVKAALLELLDADVADWIAHHRGFDRLDADFWLPAVTALFTDAAEGVARLHGCSPSFVPYWDPTDPEDNDEPAGNTVPLEDEVAEALCRAAAMATIAAQWFVERHASECC